MANNNLSYAQLFHLSLCGFGIQFASSLQTSNTSGLYKFLGVDSSNLSYLWLAAPIAGLLIQPIVGQFSDSTMTRFGKRNPYIFVWGLLAFLSLCILPVSNRLWVAAVCMWVFSCSINGCTEALRALIGDIVPNRQKTRVFSLQTIFCGVGASIAAMLPMLLNKTINPSYSPGVPRILQISFVLGGIILATTIVWMVTHIKEEKASPKKQLLLTHKKQQHPRSHLQIIVLTFQEIWQNAKRMPQVIKDFSYVQLFTWTGIFCFWLYLTPAIAQHLFDLPVGVNIASDPKYAAIMNNAVSWSGVYNGVYQFTSVLYALVLPKLADKYTHRSIHAVSLAIGAISLIAFGFVFNPYFAIPCMVGFGILWGSIMTMPYAVLCAELPRAKMGVYLGIFNITITLPQILCGLTIGSIYTHLFHGHAILAIGFAGALILIASAIMYSHTLEGNPSLLRYLKNRFLSTNLASDKQSIINSEMEILK